MSEYGKIIQFPTKRAADEADAVANDIYEMLVEQRQSEEDAKNKVIKSRVSQLEPTMQRLVEGFKQDKLQLVFFVTRSPDLDFDALSTEKRWFVTNLFKRSFSERWGIYRYPATHIMLMTHQTFQKDLDALVQLAQNNKIVLVTDKKKQSFPAETILIDPHTSAR